MGLMGTKAGMTTWFLADGEAVPCTVISLGGGCTVTQIKTRNRDGYNAIQVGYKPAKVKNMRKPEMGHLNKAGGVALIHLKEYKITKLPNVQLGKKIEVTELFREGDLVDISGTSIGKGF